MARHTILFAHSAGEQGAPDQGSYGLVSYLHATLGSGFNLLAPVIAHPDRPTYENWKRELTGAFSQINEPVILIGHSLGGSVLLKFLSEQQPQPAIRALFLVATPNWNDPEWDVEEYKLKSDFTAHLPAIPASFIYHSVDDPVVPFDHHSFYSKAFPGASVRRLPGDDHAFVQGLPALVADLRQLLPAGNQTSSS